MAASDGRPEIASSWLRSRMFGVAEDGAPRLDSPTDSPADSLAHAAAPVLARACTEFDGAPVAFVLADADARVVAAQGADRSLGNVLGASGIRPGVRMAEDVIGTNAIGTVVESRQPTLIRGTDHYLSAFHDFACFGQPIFHPITRRLEGVLDVGGAADADHRYFAPIARRLVQEIEDHLAVETPAAQRKLLAAFQAAARRKGRPVMAIGEGLVLATPAALDLLDPADHAAVRASADATRESAVSRHRLVLVSGREVEFSSSPIDGGDGVLIDFVTVRCEDQREQSAAEGWPLLVVGEAGTGRSTEARRVAGLDAMVLDAADVVQDGEQAWAVTLGRSLEAQGSPVVIENVHLLTESMATLAARLVGRTQRKVVMTSTESGIHPALLGVCEARRELVPLRRRRNDIPALARDMLAQEAATPHVRLTARTLQILAAQPWPGNAAELRCVIRAVARARSAGDIIPADLPAAYRDARAPLPPIREGERDVIVSAIEAAGGNKLRAAQSLGVSRSTLYNRMRILRIA